MNENINYLFTSNLPDDTFEVVSFKGREELCRPYEFVIQLQSENLDIELEDFNQNCLLTFNIDDSEKIVSGILSSFEQLHQNGEYAFYQAKLVPKLWRLGLYKTNEVYLDKNIEETIRQVLEETTLTESLDFEFRLSQTYRDWAFRMQYRETYLAFIHRIIEREGIYYFFEQTDSGEKIIFTDSSTEHLTLIQPEMRFQQALGLDLQTFSDSITSFLSKDQPIPGKVVVKDYNDEIPLVDISAEVTIDDQDWGEEFIYGDNIESQEEAQQIAEIKAEELICQRKQFYGEGMINRLTVGSTFNLNEHFRARFNDSYLVTHIEHEGNARGVWNFWTDDDIDDSPIYINRFTAIKSDIQFRPQRRVEKQRIYGTINAHIDAEGSGEYAELDDTGRYRVIIPFDRVSRNEGKASHWVRMSQPYAGENQGMHFPLHKGTEVLLTFIDGDPDRPIISSAVPNSNNLSVVNQDNQTNNMIYTASGNKIELEDQEGKNRIKFQTGDDTTYMHMGAPNHAGDGWVVLTTGMERKEIKGGQQITVNTVPPGCTVTSNRSDNNGSTTSAAVADSSDVMNEQSLFTFKKNATDGVTASSTLTSDNFNRDEELTGNYIFERSKGPTYSWSEGPSYNYVVGSDISITYANNTLASGGYSNNAKTYAQLESDLINDLYGSSAGYAPTGAKIYDNETTDKTWANVIKDARVSLARHDTITGQKGNIYDFGGYWNYNLGNSYEENFLSQSGTDAVFNKAYDMDILNAGGPKYTGFKTSLNGVNLNSTYETNTILSNFAPNNQAICTTKNIKIHDYEFSTQCNSIAINDKCNSLEINRGGNSIEIGFTGAGQKTSWSKSGGGNNYEKKWHPITGNMVLKSQNIRDSTGMTDEESVYYPGSGALSSYSTSSLGSTKDTFSSSFTATSSAEFNFSASASFSCDIAASISVGIVGSASTSIVTGVPALDIDMDLKFPGVSIGINAFKKELTVVVPACEIDFNSNAAKIEKKAQCELGNRMAAIGMVTMDIKKQTIALKTGPIEVKSKGLIIQ